MKTQFVEPKVLDEALQNFYLSNFIMKELRDFYTVREKESFYEQKKLGALRPRTTCKKSWPICYLQLEANKTVPETPYSIFRSDFILSNFKFDHFSSQPIYNSGSGIGSSFGPSNPTGGTFKGKPSSQRAIDSDFGKKRMSKRIQEDDLLIERQRHICECRDEYHIRMKSEIKLRLSKQLSNNTLKQVPGKASQQIIQSGDDQQSYQEFLKKTRATFLGEQEVAGSLSDNSSRKESNDLNSYSEFNGGLEYQSQYDFELLQSQQ